MLKSGSGGGKRKSGIEIVIDVWLVSFVKATIVTVVTVVVFSELTGIRNRRYRRKRFVFSIPR